MASIYKHVRGNTPYWIGVFRDHTGKQRHRSTRTQDRGQALEVCQRWQREANELGKGRRLQNKGLVMETFIAATQAAEKGEMTEAIVRKMLNELLVASGQSPMHHATVRDYLTAWMNSKEAAKSPGTAKRYRHTVSTFIDHLGRKADQSMGALLPRDIEAFRDLQLREGKSESTANMAVKTLRIPLNLARRQGLILTNPAEGVELLDAQSATRSTFTLAQLNDLLRHADWEWRGMLLFGATCGLRLGDAANLTWKQVELERKAIVYFPQKSGRGKRRKPVEAVILPSLEKWLFRWPGGNDKPDSPLFPSLYTLQTGGTNGLSRRFRKLMGVAAVDKGEDDRKIEGKGRRFFQLGFHSLRHTFISLMANLGVPRELRMKLAGHTSEVHDRYSHLELETFRRELSGFPDLALESES
jgi:integrase